VPGDTGEPGAGCPVLGQTVPDRCPFPWSLLLVLCLWSWVLASPCPVASTRGALFAPVSETRVSRMGKSSSQNQGREARSGAAAAWCGETLGKGFQALGAVDAACEGGKHEDPPSGDLLRHDARAANRLMG
jgi:hypothetical protein